MSTSCYCKCEKNHARPLRHPPNTDAPSAVWIASSRRPADQEKCVTRQSGELFPGTDVINEATAPQTKRTTPYIPKTSDLTERNTHDSDASEEPLPARNYMAIPRQGELTSNCHWITHGTARSGALADYPAGGYQSLRHASAPWWRYCPESGCRGGRRQCPPLRPPAPARWPPG